MGLQYLTDEDGNQISVIVPLKKWESLNKKTKQLKAKLEALVSLDKSMSSITKGKRGKSFKKFLDEN